jgi:hypothetical protein
MSTLTVLGRGGRPVVRLTVARVAAVAAVLVPVAVAAGALRAAAPQAPLWPAVLLGAAALWAAADPDGSGGLLTLLGLGAWWLLAVPDPATPWALPAAVSGLALHLALSVTAAGPWGAVVDRAVLVRLLRDAAAVVTVTAGIAWLAQVAHGSSDAPAPLVALVLALVGVLPWVSDARGRRRGPRSG